MSKQQAVDEDTTFPSPPKALFEDLQFQQQPFRFISPINSQFDVNPEDSVSQISSFRGTTTSTGVSSKKHAKTLLKAAQAKLQAQQIAEQALRENDLLEEEMHREIELEIKKKELELLRKRREREKEVLKAQNEAAFAELERDLLLQTQVPQATSEVSQPVNSPHMLSSVSQVANNNKSSEYIASSIVENKEIKVKNPSNKLEHSHVTYANQQDNCAFGAKATQPIVPVNTESDNSVNSKSNVIPPKIEAINCPEEKQTPQTISDVKNNENIHAPQAAQPVKHAASVDNIKTTPPSPLDARPHYGQSTPLHNSQYPVHFSQQPVFQSNISQVYSPSDPVDSFIDKLVDGQETLLECSLSAPIDPSYAILRSQEQQRLPSIEMYKFTGKPIEWPQFIERFRDQVHCKSTLTDSDRMSYLYQHLEGEARKSIESLGVSGHNYPLALKSLKRQFGNRHRVTAAHLRKLTDSPVVPPGDRTALRDYHYRVKACVTWCSKLGQTAVLHNPEYLSKAALKLPGHLRYGWYDSIHERYDTVTLKDFEQWLQKKVDTLFNPFEDYIHEQARSSRPKQPPKHTSVMPASKPALHPFTNTLSESEEASSMNVNASTVQSNDAKKEKCILCPASHRLAYCDNFKLMPLRERKKLVWDQHLCYNCLKQGHMVTQCPSDKRCLRSGCGQKHHTLLHEGNSFKGEAPEPPKSQASTGKVNSNQVNTETRGHVALQILPVKVRASNGSTVNTCALLDAGSDATLMRKDLADQLQLNGTTHHIELNTIESDLTSTDLKRVSFEIMSDVHPEPVFVNEAWVVNKMDVPVSCFEQDLISNRWSHLKDVNLPDIKDSEAKLLIGSNMAHLLVHHEVKQGRPGEPIAVRTALGWTLFGNIGDKPNPKIHSNKVALKEKDTLERHLQRFWEIDSYATVNVNNKNTVGLSREDLRATEILEQTTTMIDGHYATGMLWKRDEIVLPNNRTAAISRLHAIERKLKKQPDIAHKYQDVLNEYIENGHCKKLTPEEAACTSERTWYLPHHAVLNPNKPGKLRVVFDAAATYNNISLNDCLLVGPDFLNSLVGILMRFRLGRIGIMADVEKMFHQVRVIPQDTDSLRFVWRELDITRPPEEFKMQVHVFGATDSPCCATYALRKTAEDHPDEFTDEALHCVKRNFYVDDVLTSLSTSEEAIILAKQLIELLSTGNFRLTKWASNCREVLHALPKTELAPSVVNIGCDELPQERALGITWSLEQDTLLLKSPNLVFVDTKRGVLSAISSIFDPLGLANPYVIKAKIILQDLWRRQIDWDDVIPPDILRRWREWRMELEHSNIIQIPRWYGFEQGNAQSLDLHVFCDASETAYGAVAYLRSADAHGTITVSFVLSKCRLAPVKATTIPRLELQAAVVAIRLKCAIMTELDTQIDEIHFWSDSMIVLHYLNNSHKRFSVYVSHRVAEILDSSSSEQWHHVPGKLNVADDCTRGIRLEELQPTHRWFNGCDFLYQPKDTWPSCPRVDVDETQLEIKVSPLAVSTHAVNLVRWQECSSLSKLLHIFGWICRFSYKLRCRIQGTQPTADRTLKCLSAVDLKESLRCLCIVSQMESFPKEHADLKGGRAISQVSRILCLQPMTENGLIRVGGRLHQAPLTHESKHQIILLSTHPLARLIVQDVHESNSHVGREHTLSLLRQKYWILHGKGLVRKVLRNCLFCARRRVKPCVPVMASLPKSRFAMCEGPFTNTGVDYFGPISVKRGRSTEKRWGCLFTCLSTRAIHLELAGDLSSDAFIMCLRRFMARRGKPTMMLSDNGTNFVGANRELREALDELKNDNLVSKLAKQGITWRFNPPAAPHMGGVFESLVKQVKRVMKATLTTRVFTEDTLHTVLVETEGILNSRPLTGISDDPDDYEALTPNHFLIGRACPNTTPGQFHEREVDSRTRWRSVQAVSDMIWQRWLREYLPTLTTRTKWNKERRNVKEGDLVIVMTADRPRAEWPLARVIKVYEGKDKRVRSAEVKTPTGTLLRPVSKLCLLEGVFKD